MFKTENRVLFELLSVSQDKNKLMEHLRSLPPEYCKDKYVVKTLADSINIKVDLKKIYDKKQGGYDMCKAVDDLVMDGRMEGRMEGIKLGVAALIETMRDLGQSNDTIVNKIVEQRF